MSNFISIISLNNLNSVFTLFFRNIGYIDSTAELDATEVEIDRGSGQVKITANVTSESIQ